MKSALVACLALSLSGTAYARFSGKERSINGTGETLPQGGVEVGLASLSLGATHELMIEAPTLPMLAGIFGVGARYKFQVNQNFRVSPGLGIGFSTLASEPTGHGSLIFGFDFPGRTNSLDVGVLGSLNSTTTPREETSSTWALLDSSHIWASPGHGRMFT